MACFHPITGYRGQNGRVNFGRSGGFIDLPRVTIKCGQCIGCSDGHSQMWAIRMMHENQMHNSQSIFLTLTYETSHLPIGRTLVKKHLQDFIKRLRKNHGPFRYVACGEYGDRKGRPHYHLVIFGQPFHQDRKFYKTSKAKFSGSKSNLYTHPAITKAWPKGRATYGEVTPESCQYVAKYLHKKITGPQAGKHYLRFHEDTGLPYQLQPEFLVMSTRPGIGKTWIDKYMADVYPRDEIIFKGHPHQPPHYYDLQYEKLEPKKFREIQYRRREKANLPRKAKHKTWQRLKQREFVAWQKHSHIEREPD